MMNINIKHCMMLAVTALCLIWCGSQGVELWAQEPQEVPRAGWIYSSWNRINGMARSGDWLFLATRQNGLQIISITDPENPILTGYYRLPGVLWDIEVQDEIAYLIGGNNVGLTILDVSDPTNITRLGMLETGGLHLEIVRDLAYVVVSTQDIIVYDISDPESPTQVSNNRILNVGNITDFCVKDTMIYVIRDYSTLYTFNAADSSRIRQTNRDGTGRDLVRILSLYENLLALSSSSGIVLFSLEDPESPQLIDIIGDVNIKGLGFQQDRLYAVYDTFLTVYDIDEPDSVIITERVGLNITRQVEVMDIFDELAFIQFHSNDSVAIWDLSERDEPREFSRLGCDYGGYSKVEITGSHAYLSSGRFYLNIVELSDPNQLVEIGQYDLRQFLDFSLYGERAYLSYGSELKGFDFSAPENIRQFWEEDSVGTNYNILARGNRLYAFTSSHSTERNLITYDISDPESPQYLGAYRDTTYRISTNEEGNVVSIGRGSGEIVIMDLTEVDNPVQLGEYQFRGEREIQDLEWVDDRLYIGTKENGVGILDISDPTAPEIAGFVVTQGIAANLAVSGDLLFVAERESGLEIFDVSNPRDIRLVGFTRPPIYASDVALYGDYAVVAEATSVEIFDCSGVRPRNEVLRPVPNVFGVALHVSPNPFNEMLSIQFDLPRSGIARLNIHDLMGRQVVQLIDGQGLPGGEQLYSWEAGGLAAGVYFVTLEWEGTVKVSPVILSK